MKDDEKGYVTPTPVNTNEQVSSTDTMLGRERDNIIIATNQVNNSINEEQIKETNNKIKYKQTPLMVKFLAIVGTIMLIFFVSFYVIKYSKQFIEGGKVVETTTTTSSPLERSKEYFNKDIVRKYVSDNKIYLFLPPSYGNYIYEITYDNKGVTSTLIGIYDEDVISLSLDDVYPYEISDNGIKINGEEYKINSGELKYYTYLEEDNYNILVINATPNALQGLYISNGISIEGKYFEYDDKITITNDNGVYEFIKIGDAVSYNNVNLNLVI